MWEKIGKKSIFHLDFCMKIFKFSQKFQISNFAQTRKGLPFGFLISFRIINDFQQPTNLTFIIIKISFLIKNTLVHENNA